MIKRAVFAATVALLVSAPPAKGEEPCPEPANPGAVTPAPGSTTPTPAPTPPSPAAPVPGAVVPRPEPVPAACSCFCTSRRSFRIRIREVGSREIASVAINVQGQRERVQRVRETANRYSTTVSFVGQRAVRGQLVAVAITVRFRGERRPEQRLRFYRLCLRDAGNLNFPIRV